MDIELKQAQESVEKAFHDFRQANDEALKQKADKGYVDGLLEEKITKLNARIDESRDELKRRLDDQEKARQKERLFGGANSGEDGSGHVESFSRQMSAVHGSRVALSAEDFMAYKSALMKQFRKGSAGLLPEEQAALRVGVDPDGGYWVTPDTGGRIATKLFETSPMRQICSVQTVSTDKLEGIIDNDEADSGWVGEEESRAATGTPQIGKWSIDVHEQYASPKATQKLLDDAEVDVESWLTAKIADKLARVENTAFVSGTGVTQPIGFLSTPTPVTTADSSRAWGTLQYFPSGASGAFDSSLPGDYLIDLVFGLKAGYRSNAVFLMARSTLAGVRKLKDGDGNYLWQPDFGSRQGGALLGYPIVEAEDMPVIGSNSFSIAFGDFRAGYQIVDRSGIRVLRDPFTAKPYVVFYATKRVGGGLVNSEAIKLFKFAAS